MRDTTTSKITIDIHKTDVIMNVEMIEMPIKLSRNLKEIYNNKKESLEKRNLAEPIEIYIAFTAYFFPDALDELEKMPNRYFNFIEEFIDRKIILEKYFKQGESVRDIAKQFKLTTSAIYAKMAKYKEIAKYLYAYFCATGKLKNVKSKNTSAR